MLKVCCGVTNGREKDGGVQAARSDSRLKGRELWELRYALSVRACARVFEPSGSVVVC